MDAGDLPQYDHHKASSQLPSHNPRFFPNFVSEFYQSRRSVHSRFRLELKSINPRWLLNSRIRVRRISPRCSNVILIWVPRTVMFLWNPTSSSDDLMVCFPFLSVISYLHYTCVNKQYNNSLHTLYCTTSRS